MSNQEQIIQDKPVKFERDKLNRIKVLVSIYKGISMADPEGILSNKLMMFRLKVTVSDDLSKYIPLPVKVAIERVEQTDIDFELFKKFLESKWKKSSVLKFLMPFTEIYKDCKVGQKMGELEMDYSTFKGLLQFLQILSYETFKTENVIG